MPARTDKEVVEALRVLLDTSIWGVGAVVGNAARDGWDIPEEMLSGLGVEYRTIEGEKVLVEAYRAPTQEEFDNGTVKRPRWKSPSCTLAECFEITDSYCWE